MSPPEQAPGLRTLLFSTLFPSSTRPVHGIFVETRLRELLSSGQVQTRVVAPVPWFWSRDARWGDYARMAATPPAEQRNGIQVVHPRYAVVPKIGMTAAPTLLAAAALGTIRRMQRDGFDFDLIDAHYYYPDGVAAALVAKALRKPFVVTARGTDLNLIPQHRLPRAQILWAARRANASIGVCAALVDVLRGWGLDPARLHVMRNGVDLQRFRPLPQADMRAELGLEGAPLLLSVGHLIERKGHHLVVDAMLAVRQSFPGAKLLIVGEGEERPRLEARIRAAGLSDCVRLAGAIPNAQLARYYSAADMLVLASSREGWANVLLEAMACGTPVVATRIWGTPEVVAVKCAGLLVDERSSQALAEAIASLARAGSDRDAVRKYAEAFSWEQTTQAQLDLFRKVVREGVRKPAHA